MVAKTLQARQKRGEATALGKLTAMVLTGTAGLLLFAATAQKKKNRAEKSL